MTRKQWMLIALAVVLGGMSLYLNKDWFGADDIQIYHRSSPRPAQITRKKQDPQAAVAPLIFGFDRKLRIKAIKVIPLSDIETNKYPHPIWHLLSESNSVPTKSFNYGARIPGMHSAVKNATAYPLAPGVKYRLIVEVGKTKLEHDFEPLPPWR